MGKGEYDGAFECCVDWCFNCCFCCMFIFVLVNVGLGIASIVIGAMHLHNCDLEKMVPIYLIVSACAQILLGGFRNNEEEDSGLPASFICGFIGYLFNIAWLICGSVWVYPTYAKVHEDTYTPCQHVNGTYTPTGCTVGTCNDTLLNFSFAAVTINWIVMAIMTSVVGNITIRRVKTWDIDFGTGTTATTEKTVATSKGITRSYSKYENFSFESSQHI